MSKVSFLQFMEDRVQINDNSTILHPYIIIPLIQRDYVEGRRKNNNKIEGENFLNTIFNTIQDRELMLDYIYGNIKGIKDGDNEELNFIPLDGQQRLTTLFLLYWYIGNIELDDEAKYENLKKTLRRFSYETRVSAKDFCKMLCDMDRYSISENITIKEFIRGKKEFYYDYNLDPTICNMLETLLRIEEIYKEKQLKYYDKLENIKFDLLIMDNYGLTDELYIKMNARGKKLTNFENFKADLIDFMNRKCSEDSFKLLKDVTKYNNRDCSYMERFSWKLDNEWLDNLWENICKKDKTIIDNMYQKIIYIYFLALHDFSKKDKNNDNETRSYLSNNNEYDNFAVFEDLLSDAEKIEQLEKFLDCFLKEYDKIRDNSIPCWNKKYNFCNLSSNDDIEFKTLLNIISVETFIKKSSYISINNNNGFYSIDSNKGMPCLKKWMRTINNIIENSDVDSYDSYRACLSIIEQLSDHVDDIYDYLAKSKDQFKSSKDAIEEEKLKCSLISNNPNDSFEKTFIELESNAFLRGSIYFILDDNISFQTLEKRAEMWEELFKREKEFIKNAAGRDKLLIKNFIKVTPITTSMNPSKKYNEYHFVDFDEDEHFLKKSLRSDFNYQKLLKTLLDKNDITDVENYLNKGISSQNISGLNYINKMLIESDDLIDWTFDGNKRYYYKNRSGQFSVGTTRASVNWTSLNQERLKIQKYLFDKKYSCENRIKNTNFVSLDEAHFANNNKLFVIKKDGTIVFQENNNAEEALKDSKGNELNYLDNKHFSFSEFEQWCKNKKI